MTTSAKKLRDRLNESLSLIDKIESEQVTGMNGETYEVLKNLTQWAECNVCLHENTHRGGSIWKICDDCGQKWADDEGGMPESAKKLPEEIQNAIDLLNRK